MEVQRYPEGWDFAWVASDERGYVAAFVTGGEGPIPEAALLQTELAEVPEAMVAALPLTTSAIAVGTYNRMDSFLEMAARGLYVFDWADVHRIAVERTGFYELIARPEVAVNVDALPEPLRSAAASMLLGSTDFSQCDRLAVKGIVRGTCA